MWIYTLGGELVLAKDFGVTTAACYAPNDCGPNPQGFVWNRANSAGHRVARGVYYALIREEETLGGRNVLQTVRKFLVR